MKLKVILFLGFGFVLAAQTLPAQSFRFPWSCYGHGAQHDGISSTPSQPLSRIVWQTSLDLSPPGGDELTIHYGSPLITRSNSVIVSVKTQSGGEFVVKSLVGATGATKWSQPTDYILPPHDWIPSYSPALTPRNRLYFPGGGGTVYYCDTPDAAASPVIGQLAFYGLSNYSANSNTYLAKVFIDTPITADRYGNIFFGFQVTGSTPASLRGGLARIDYDGSGTWISASNAVHNVNIGKVTQNCAPALSNDHKTLYVAVNSTNYHAYLLALDSRTLAVLNFVRLKDAHFPANDANLGDNGSSSATVGPDGDVYFGVQENPLQSNNNRGWLLHFDSTLTQTKLPGAFGWDATPSVVPASMVPSYHGASSYLLVTKYNNYADSGGDGVNKMGILDPQDSMTDPVTGISVMKEILTIAGQTPDPDYTATFPNAVYEWCINSAAVDPFTKSILVNNEDGKLYRWDVTSNTLSETLVLTSGTGEAYTPTAIGVDGLVYAINDSIVFAVGR